MFWVAIVSYCCVMKITFAFDGRVDGFSYRDSLKNIADEAGYAIISEALRNANIQPYIIDPEVYRDQLYDKIKLKLQALSEDFINTVHLWTLNGSFVDETTNIGNVPSCSTILGSNKYQPVYSDIFKRKIDIKSVCYCRSSNSVRFPAINFINIVANMLTERQQQGGDVRGLTMKPLFRYYAFDTGFYIQHPMAYVSPQQCDMYEARTLSWYVDAYLEININVVIAIDITADTGTITIPGINNEARNFSEALKAAVQSVIKTTLSVRQKVGLVTFPIETQLQKTATSGCFLKEPVPADAKFTKEISKFLGEVSLVKGYRNISQALSAALKLLQTNPGGAQVQPVVILFMGGLPVDTPVNWVTILGATKDWKILPRIILYYLGNDASTNLYLKNFQIYGQGQCYYQNLINFNSIPLVGFYYKYLPQSSKSDYTAVVFDTPFSFNTERIVRMCVPFRSNASENSVGKILGVACQEMLFEDVFGDLLINDYGKNTYSFLLEVPSGNIVYHPYAVAVELDFIIKYRPLASGDTAENQPGIDNVIQSMMAGQTAYQICNARYISPTSKTFTGQIVRTVQSTYAFRPVLLGKNYWSLCYVQPVGYLSHNMSLKYPNGTVNFVSPRLDLVPNPQLSNASRCKHFNSMSYKDASMCLLSPQAFLDQFPWYLGQETADQVELLIDIVSGVTNNTLLTDRALNDIILTSFLSSEWSFSNLNGVVRPYAVWNFFGTTSGVLRMYPCPTSVLMYDFLTDDWFLEAVANRDLVIMSPPSKIMWSETGEYNLGANYLNFIGRAVLIPGSSKVFGVAGFAVTLHYMYMLTELYVFKECQFPFYVCFLVNNVGVVVSHTTWTYADWSTVPRLVNVHISELEGAIATHLIQQNYLKFTSCITKNASTIDEYPETIYKFFTILELEQVDYMNNTGVKYKAQRVTGSNVFVFARPMEKLPDDCKCKRGEIPDTIDRVNDVHYLILPTCFSYPLALAKTCQCPCQYPVNQITQCPSQLTVLPNDDSVPPSICYPNPFRSRPIVRLHSQNSNIKETRSYTEIQPCSGRTCIPEKARRACHNINNCRWCDRLGTGQLSPRNFCDSYEICYFGQIGRVLKIRVTSTHLSSHVLVPLVIIVIVIPIISSLLFYYFFKKRTSNVKSKSQLGDTLSAVPSGVLGSKKGSKNSITNSGGGRRRNNKQADERSQLSTNSHGQDSQTSVNSETRKHSIKPKVEQTLSKSPSETSKGRESRTSEKSLSSQSTASNKTKTTKTKTKTPQVLEQFDSSYSQIQEPLTTGTSTPTKSTKRTTHITQTPDDVRPQNSQIQESAEISTTRKSGKTKTKVQQIPGISQSSNSETQESASEISTTTKSS